MKKGTIGKKGEEFASFYLQSLEHTILFSNYRKKIGEIDIISIKNDTLHCSEVKTWNERFGFHPKECLHATKRARMRKVYLYLLQEIPAFFHLTPSFNLIHITEKKEVRFYSSIF
ncbi:YraN family protein [Leptospira biflexa]|uniref:YraN family protein n=1 Tax=Leptospira biflexa TaxID=172 RepID=UPI001083F1C3|nr:YraN family protein [Leptospira biflexa]TGM38937.1 YraN family protein [Leptospira biflexa]TGM39910.1 YraN family protein [Leptospira biflexa]